MNLLCLYSLRVDAGLLAVCRPRRVQILCAANCDSILRNRDWVTRIPSQAAEIREPDPYNGTQSLHLVYFLLKLMYLKKASY